jgi:hypothetical protein
VSTATDWTHNPAQLSLLDDPLETRFRHFIYENPHVVRRVTELAYEWKNAGHDKCSMELIFAMLRWKEGIETRGDQFRLNDAWTSRMSRLVMQLEPALDGFFNTRVLRADRERSW